MRSRGSKRRFPGLAALATCLGTLVVWRRPHGYVACGKDDVLFSSPDGATWRALSSETIQIWTRRDAGTVLTLPAAASDGVDLNTVGDGDSCFAQAMGGVGNQALVDR